MFLVALATLGSAHRERGHDTAAAHGRGRALARSVLGRSTGVRRAAPRHGSARPALRGPRRGCPVRPRWDRSARAAPRRAGRRRLSHAPRSSGGDLAEDVQARILAEAAGNPLALIELPIAAADDLDRDAAVASAAADGSARSRVRGPVEALDTDVRTLLLLAALDDRDVDRAEPGGRRAPRGTRLPQRLDEGCRLRPRIARRRQVPVPSPTDAVGGAPGGDGQQRRDAHAALARTLAGRSGPGCLAPGCGRGRTRREGRRSTRSTAADRAESRGGHDVAFAALERAADPDRGSGAARTAAPEGRRDRHAAGPIR